MITSRDIFQIILTDQERDQLYGELLNLLPTTTVATANTYPLCYHLRRKLREVEE